MMGTIIIEDPRQGRHRLADVYTALMHAIIKAR